VVALSLGVAGPLLLLVLAATGHSQVSRE
jgi:hypothetical protein